MHLTKRIKLRMVRNQRRKIKQIRSPMTTIPEQAKKRAKSQLVFSESCFTKTINPNVADLHRDKTPQSAPDETVPGIT